MGFIQTTNGKHFILKAMQLHAGTLLRTIILIENFQLNTEYSIQFGPFNLIVNFHSNIDFSTHHRTFYSTQNFQFNSIVSNQLFNNWIYEFVMISSFNDLSNPFAHMQTRIIRLTGLYYL